MSAWLGRLVDPRWMGGQVGGSVGMQAAGDRVRGRVGGGQALWPC